MLNHPEVITEGYTAMIHCHTASVKCTFSKITEKIDRRTGRVLEYNPRQLENAEAAIACLTPQTPLCVEPFSQFSNLGRFAVLDLGRTVAVGLIKSVQKK